MCVRYAGFNNVDLNECVPPNTDQTSAQTPPSNPAKSDGKKRQRVSPVSDTAATDDDADMQVSHYCRSHTGLSSHWLQAGWENLVSADTSIRPRERIRGWKRPNLRAAAFVLWGNCMGGS